MDKSVYIEYLDCYLPESKLDLADYPDDIGDVRVELRLELEEMVMLLLDKFMQSNDAVVRTVKYLIIATDYSYGLRDFGHRISYRLAIPHCTVFRVGDNYCTNVDIAIGLAACLLREKREPSRAIIIAGTRLGDDLAARVVGTYGILGDSAGMVVLSNDGGTHLAEVGGQVVITRGELAEMDLTKDNTILHLQSYSICLKELLSQSGLLPSMVDQVVIHNANQMLLLQVFKSCGINGCAINRSNLGKYGHLGTCDLILNLKTVLERDERTAGNVVSLNLGIIGTYVSTLFKQ